MLKLLIILIISWLVVFVLGVRRDMRNQNYLAEASQSFLFSHVYSNKDMFNMISKPSIFSVMLQVISIAIPVVICIMIGKITVATVILGILAIYLSLIFLKKIVSYIR